MDTNTIILDDYSTKLLKKIECFNLCNWHLWRRRCCFNGVNNELVGTVKTGQGIGGAGILGMV